MAVSLEKTFRNKLVPLACRHHEMELLCDAAASMIYSAAGSMIQFCKDLSSCKTMVANARNHESERLRKLRKAVANKLENLFWCLNCHSDWWFLHFLQVQVVRKTKAWPNP